MIDTSELPSRTKTKPRLRETGFCFKKNPGDDLLLHGLSHTTIGAAVFHFRVRDGIGWYHSAVVTRERVEGRRLRMKQRHALRGWGRGSRAFVASLGRVEAKGFIRGESKKLEVIWSSHTDH